MATGQSRIGTSAQTQGGLASGRGRPGEDNSRTAISPRTKRSNTDSGDGYAALTVLRTTDASVRHGGLEAHERQLDKKVLEIECMGKYT